MDKKVLFKFLFFVPLFCVVVAGIWLLRLTDFIHDPLMPHVYLAGYNLLVLILGFYLILFFKNYARLDQVLFLVIFAAAAVSFRLFHAFGPDYWALTAGYAAFFTGLAFFPNAYAHFRNSLNENMTARYTPLIEQIMEMQRSSHDLELEVEKLERNKENMSFIYQIVTTINQKLEIQEVFDHLKDIFINRIGIGNLVIIVRDDEKLDAGYEKNQYVLFHNLDEPMKTYVNYIENKISHFFYLSSLSFYTLRVADDWPDAVPEAASDAFESFMVIPFYIQKKPKGFIGFFLKSQGDIKDLELNFAVFTVRNISLTLNKILLYQKIKKLSTRDGLTKLSLRRVFRERLEKEFERSRRYNKPLSLIMMDIDHFKKFNDSYGHLLGDDVLKKVGSHILQGIEQHMLAARYGGEEFAVICPAPCDSRTLALSIKRSIQEDFVETEDHQRLKIKVSVGVAELVPGIHSIDELIRRADEALYFAKEHGRDRIVFYPDAPVA